MEPRNPPPGIPISINEIAPGVHLIKADSFPIGFVVPFEAQFQAFLLSPVADATLDQAVSRITYTAVGLARLASDPAPRILRPGGQH